MDIKSIEDIRSQIDNIDSQIVKLIAERQKYVSQAAKFKKNQAEVRAPDRVSAVVEKVKSEAVSNGLSPVVIERVYRSMISAFIEYELEQHKEINT